MTNPVPTRLHRPLAALPHLAGRRAVVTGGASGLGLATTRALAVRGVDVVIAARNVGKAAAVRDRLTAEHNLSVGRVTVEPLDLIDPESVRRFSDTVTDAPLDLLVLNAGISSVPLRHDQAGIESQFATNHLGHFALAARLLPALEYGTDPRVVTVSSALYTGATLGLNDLASAHGYSPGRAYSRSKLANVIFAVELQRRLQIRGSAVRSVAAHPGMARTPLHSTYSSAVTRALTHTLAVVIGRKPDAASVGILAAALHPHAQPDLFWGPIGSKTDPDARGVRFAAKATDRTAATALWQVSERLTATRIP